MTMTVRFLVLAILVWQSNSATAQQYEKEYLVVVLKQNYVGVAVDAFINTVGGSMQFFKYNYTGNDKGERIAFENVEDLVGYVDAHGYDLINSLLLRPEDYIDTRVDSKDALQFVQYIFKRRGSGYAPLRI